MSEWSCPECGMIDAEIDAPTVAVVNALYPNETLDEIPPVPGDIRVQTARHAISAYLTAARVIPPAENGAVDPEWIKAQRVAGWPDMHPEDYCHRCGSHNPNWWTDTETWRTATAAWAAETGREGICCPRCLILMHEAATGRPAGWQLSCVLPPANGGAA